MHIFAFEVASQRDIREMCGNLCSVDTGWMSLQDGCNHLPIILGQAHHPKISFLPLPLPKSLPEETGDAVRTFSFLKMLVKEINIHMFLNSFPFLRASCAGYLHQVPMVPEEILMTMRGLAFEDVYLVKDQINKILAFSGDPRLELHLAVVLVSGNDRLFGQQGHNCVRIEFAKDGLFLSTMTQDKFDTIKTKIIESWEEHDCLGKRVAAVLAEWNGSEYHLMDRNCIHFADALLKRIGIESKKVAELLYMFESFRRAAASASA